MESMETFIVRPGDRVIVRSATGDLVRRAVTGPVPGQDFTVVRVAQEKEFERAEAEGRQARSTPWPVEDVRPA